MLELCPHESFYKLGGCKTKTVLLLQNEPYVIDQIKTLVSAEINFNFYYKDSLRDFDNVGVTLRYVKAKEFRKITSQNRWNTAILLFLCMIDGDTPIILLWS